jgi:hypothetical protein
VINTENKVATIKIKNVLKAFDVSINSIGIGMKENGSTNAVRYVRKSQTRVTITLALSSEYVEDVDVLIAGNVETKLSFDLTKKKNTHKTIQVELKLRRCPSQQLKQITYTKECGGVEIKTEKKITHIGSITLCLDNSFDDYLPPGVGFIFNVEDIISINMSRGLKETFLFTGSKFLGYECDSQIYLQECMTNFIEYTIIQEYLMVD